MPHYAVRKGHNIGVYNSWDECNQQTCGYKGAIFKKFNTFEEAQQFINGEQINQYHLQQNIANIESIIYVDGGFNKATGKNAWGSVVNGYGNDLIPYAYSQGLINDMELKEAQLPKGRRVVIVTNFENVNHQNNGAELIALVVGLRLAIHLNNINIPVKTVFSDSQVVLYWSIRLKDESALLFDPRKVTYINELIQLRRIFESNGGKVEKVDSNSNLADLK